jgi:mannosyltransferase OCH1-like enzyme
MIYIFIAIIAILIYLYMNRSITIPKIIFQTWNTLTIPPKMQEAVNKLKADHPEFAYYLYDDAMCRDFINTHFDKRVVDAFDTLKPGAYKADLWRYCILYIKGGIYLDIKYECVSGFSLNQLLDREYFVLDRPGWWKKGEIGIYNGVMVCVANNPILRLAIDKIVENVENREYGMNILYPTGPGLLGEMHGNDTTNFVLSYTHPEEIIHSTKGCILKGYTGYRKEQKQFHPLETYHELWPKRKIFN